MKKLIIGAIVGGILLFIWQSLSFTLLDLHGKAFQYTPRQEAIMASLNSLLTEDGQYFLPRAEDESNTEQREAMTKNSQGKPWAMISYHKSMDMNMGMNMIRGLLIDIVAIAMFCWIVSKMDSPTMGKILTASVFTGLIVFFTASYTAHIWYETFDLMAHFMDAIVGWGLVGIWLGWWYSRKTFTSSTR